MSTPAVRISPRAVIRQGDRYLVVRYRDPAGDWYVFPGGGQRPGEDLHQALIREVREEIGVAPTVGALACVRECIADRLPPSTTLRPGFHQLELFFHCDLNGATPTGGLTPDPNQSGIAWHTLAELRLLRFFPQLILRVLEGPAPTYLGVC
jgi:8-oxo-dGTP pyrophosphatase MutT (NUDIX family)